MEFTEIRKTLKLRNIPEVDIKFIIQSINKQVLKELEIESQNQKAKENKGLGIAITLIGLTITIGTFIGMINMGNSFLFAYGPLFGGLVTLFVGIAQYRREKR